MCSVASVASKGPRYQPVSQITPLPPPLTKALSSLEVELLRAVKQLDLPEVTLKADSFPGEELSIGHGS